ncbi:MAG: ferritin-like domain-containing protein [Myxococcales bacterium]|nr:ferritin-like domain-containing protein [Myxococcales bacterium]
MDPISAVIGLALTGNTIEKEYRALDEAIRRTERLVPEFDPKTYDARALARALDSWERRMVFEHRSTTVFANLAVQLFEANASLDAKTVMLRMAQDEVRHTETCGQVVIGLGGTGEVAADVAVPPLASHRGVSPEERALRNVIYTTSMSEMVAIAMLVDELDQTKDRFLRDATRRLLADEVLHGQFGFLYLEAWRPWLDAHPDVKGSLGRYLTHAFKVIEGVLGGPVQAEAPLSEDELALGLHSSARGREIFYETMEHAIVPGLERFGIEAGKAWKERRLLEGGTVPERPRI